jgi:small GTP-binding protein
LGYSKHGKNKAGQEAYKSITRSYYRGTIGVVLVYDISSLASFQNAARWLEEAKNFATNENIEVVLVGNKSDKNSEYNAL